MEGPTWPETAQRAREKERDGKEKAKGMVSRKGMGETATAE